MAKEDKDKNVETPTEVQEDTPPKEAPKEEPETSTKQQSKEKEETVEVSKADLQSILDTVQEQKKAINRLESAADVGRLAKYDSEHAENLIREARLGLWEHKGEKKYVVGWKMVKDEVGVYDGKVVEHQVIGIYLDSGEGKNPVMIESEYLNWARNLKRVTGQIIRESKTPEGETRTLKFEDGREIEVDIRFINP